LTLACTPRDYLMLALLSMLPGFEGRYAVLLGANCLPYSAIVAYASSTATGMLVYMLLERIERLVEKLGPLSRVYKRVRMRVASRIGPDTRLATLILFIAVPLPGSGVWSGALAARLLNLDTGRSVAAIVAGNLVAITITSLSAAGVLSAVAPLTSS